MFCMQVGRNPTVTACSTRMEMSLSAKRTNIWTPVLVCNPMTMETYPSRVACAELQPTTCRRLKPTFRTMPSTNRSFEHRGWLSSSRVNALQDISKRGCQVARKMLLFIVVLFAALITVRGETIILHLKNGDRLAGTIISEDTNRVIITTSWVKELAVRVSEIERRESVPAAGAPKVAEQKPAPSAPSSVTNVIPSAIAGVPVAIATPPPPPPKPAAKPKHWKGELKVGADFING